MQKIKLVEAGPGEPVSPANKTVRLGIFLPGDKLLVIKDKNQVLIRRGLQNESIIGEGIVTDAAYSKIKTTSESLLDNEKELSVFILGFHNEHNEPHH